MEREERGLYQGGLHDLEYVGSVHGHRASEVRVVCCRGVEFYSWQSGLGTAFFELFH